MKKTCDGCRGDPDCSYGLMDRRMLIGDGIETFIRSTDGRSQIRAVFLGMIRSIVEKHGGVLNSVDFGSNMVDCKIPEENAVACSLEVEEVLSKYGC